MLGWRWVVLRLSSISTVTTKFCLRGCDWIYIMHLTVAWCKSIFAEYFMEGGSVWRLLIMYFTNMLPMFLSLLIMGIMSSFAFVVGLWVNRWFFDVYQIFMKTASPKASLQRLILSSKFTLWNLLFDTGGWLKLMYMYIGFLHGR